MKKISRRSVLVAAGMSVVALALTACGSSSTASSSAASGSADAQAITALEDLKGKTVGVQLGTTGDLYMSGEVGGELDIAAVEQYNKAGDAVQALLSNKIDAVCIDDQVAKKFVEANADKLTILDTAYAEEDYAA